MCGIFGYVNAGIREDTGREKMRAMAEALRHRGPDSEGYHVENGMAMGMVRLSIIDVAGGDQPIYSPDRRYAIVFNGEIYNHLELRKQSELTDYPFSTHSDTETLLAAFLRMGTECLHRLNGMFAFAIWDSHAKRLFLARDRFGIKPLYWKRHAGEFLFSSEARPLLPEHSTRPDVYAIAQYLRFGYMPSPLCGFEGVEKFPAGHYAVVEDGRIKLEQWHRFHFGRNRLPQKELVDQLDQQLDTAVQRELLSDVPIGVFLSGGIDSSLAAAYAAKSHPGIASFALSFSEATHDEGKDAELVASHLRLPHKTLRLDYRNLETLFDEVGRLLDEPFADSTVLPLLALSRFAAREVKVVLTGWGGDEVFMGYPTMKAHRLAGIYRRLPRLLRDSAIPFLVGRLPVSDKYMSFEFKARRFISGMNSGAEKQHLAWMGYFGSEEIDAVCTGSVAGRLNEHSLFADAAVASLEAGRKMDRIMELDYRLFLEGNGLFQADRMSMAASLEARVPLLNPALVDWADALDWRCKMPGLELKTLLRRLGERYLPRAITRKPKKGFGPPTSQWIRGPLREKVSATLSRERLEASGLLDPIAVSRLFEEHLNRKSDNGRKIWALASLQVWMERHSLRVNS